MKIFDASVKGGQVIADNGIIESCPILGEGGDSSGYLVIAEGSLVYLPKTSPDLKETLTILKELTIILKSEIFPANLGGAITADSYAANIELIGQKLDKLKAILK